MGSEMCIRDSIDDVLGIIALTIVTSLADDSVKIGMVLIKIVGFFVFSGVVGFVFYKMYKKWVDGAEKELHRHTIIAFVFCLLMAFIAEEVLVLQILQVHISQD